jgi:hypothetical protein
MEKSCGTSAIHPETYGNSCDTNYQRAPRRAAACFDRVVIAGDWVGSEGMLADTAVASALKAAQLVSRSKSGSRLVMDRIRGGDELARGFFC